MLGHRGGLALAIGALLVLGGLTAIAGAGHAAPSDPPSVDVEQDVRTAVNQTLVIRAENTNNDGATSWSIDVPSGVTVDHTRVSDDELTFWARLTITPDAPGSPFDVTFTATDGQGYTDTANTTLDVRTNADEADIQAHDDAVVEDTSLNLTADVHLYSDTADRVEVVKNYVGGATQIADAVDADTYTAGPFDYEHPGTHQVGYRTVDAEGHEVTLVHDLDVTEKAPEISTSIDQFDTTVDQRVSFVVTASDSDGESFTLSAEGGDELSNVTLLQDGDRSHFVGTIAENLDGVVYATITADDGTASSSETVQFDIGTDPDVEVKSPLTALEDEPVTLTVNATRTGTAVQDVTIWKNFLVDGEIYKNKHGGTNVDGDTWEATFTYGQSGAHVAGYTVEGDDGSSVTLLQDIEILEDSPSLSAPDSFTVTDRQEIVLFATSTDGDETLEWNVTVDNATLAENGVLQSDGDAASYRVEVPFGFDADSVDVTFEVADPDGNQDTATTMLDVAGTPHVDPYFPLETNRSIYAINPILGEEVKLSALVDDSIQGLEIVSTWTDGTTSVPDGETALPDGRDVFAIDGVTYTSAGSRDVGYVATTPQGEHAAVLQDIRPEVNDPPVLLNTTLGTEDTFEGEAIPRLRALADDPEGRVIEATDIDWIYAGGPQFDNGTLLGEGRDITGDVHLDIGVHEIVAEVTDPYGANDTANATLIVDDGISASGAMLSAQTQTSDGVYVVDPLAHDPTEALEGEVTVTDLSGNNVFGADVSGEVLYYGPEVTVQPLATTDEISETSGSDGVASFEVTEDPLSPEDDGSVTLPGYHEIQLTVSADSDPFAPIPDTETATVTIPYWVGPGLVGPS